MSGLDLPGVVSLTRTDMTVTSVLTGDRGARPGGRDSGTSARAEAAPNDEGPSRTRQVSKPCRAGLPSSAIHELRTPLTSIHGYSQVLQRSLRDNARATNALSVVVRESTRLSSMLEQLSELAELESDGHASGSSEVKVEELVSGVAFEAAHRDNHAHPIVVEGAARAICNPSLVGRALAHLLANAAQYSPPGSPIALRIDRVGATVEVCVEDQGIGVEQPDAERIYQPFERGSNARRAGIRGLGLGLFLACRALEETGGTLDHYSADGRTIFRVRLPAS
ncbi:MAG: HAMP domain-containing sensor histidine kinase [Chloroflexota bacterium]